MRSSAVLASLCAALAVASPVNKALLEKKAIVYDIVTDIVYVTVTEGVPIATPPPPPKTTVVVKHTVTASHSQKPNTKTSVIPVPVPTTSAAPVVVAPPPTTSAAPVVVATPEPAPVVVATTSQAPVAAKVATPAAAASPTDYKSTALYHHNMHRANHSASALVWDDTLTTYALATANKCVFAHDMTQGNGGYGQNLAAYGTTSDLNSLNLGSLVADSITNQWYYGEAAAVPYGQNSPDVSGPEFLHFTQVIWKASTKVGCATVQCGAGTIFSYHSLYTVCNYASQGNVLGAFIDNVAEPIGTAAISANIS